jgi:hypothetical protein
MTALGQHKSVVGMQAAAGRNRSLADVRGFEVTSFELRQGGNQNAPAHTLLPLANSELDGVFNVSE